MTNDPAQLLSLLAGGIRPDGASPTGPRAPVEGRSFQEMLAGLQGGGIETGRPVVAARGVTADLGEALLQRLSSVVDQAEMSGATRLMVLAEGKAITIDVLNRQIVDVRDQEAGAVHVQIDAVVNLNEGHASAGPGAPTLGELGILNKSLGEILAQHATRGGKGLTDPR